MNWELIASIIIWWLIIIIHIIPALIAIYYLIKRKQWFALLPMSCLFAFPIIGTIASYAQILSKGEEFSFDIPMILNIIIFVPINLLIICLFNLV